MFLEKTSRQNTQLLNAEATYLALLDAKNRAKPYQGSMFWREVNGKKYLMRWTPPDQQKSLGPLTAENYDAVENFRKNKEETQLRVQSLSEEMDVHKKLNKALRVGRVPDVVVSTINAIQDAGLEKHFMVIGTHAIFAYETAAGVLFPGDALATEDIDILLDTRKKVKFFTQMKRLDASFLQILQKADKSFRILEGQLYTAINDKGFQVDVVRRMAGDQDPHPLRLSDNEEDLWPVQVSSGEKLLSARPFEQTIVSGNGQMAIMHTVHPLDFVRIKQLIGKKLGRDPLKARKDLLQASLVRQLVDTYLPHLAT